MKIFVIIALQFMIIIFGEAIEIPSINNEEKDRRFVESKGDSKQDPVLWMIVKQLERMQTKLGKFEEEFKKMGKFEEECTKMGKFEEELKKMRNFNNQITKSVDDFSRTQSKIEDKVKGFQSEITMLKKDSKGFQSEITMLKKDSKGATYVRWGKSRCSGSNTETVYEGQVGGGSYHHAGAGVNYLCLSNNPNVSRKLPSGSSYNYLYGAEYEIDRTNKPDGMKSNLYNHDVPCVVCNAKGKTRILMIPGRNMCYHGWKHEYDGYLMAGYYLHAAASDYACLDKNPETIHGGHANHNGKLFYPVNAQCGSLHCPPYQHDTEVLCVVCSK